MRRLLAIISSSAVVLFGFAAVATANTGSIVASENCQSFIVHVYLTNNVSIDRTVIVTTTIPDTTGIAGNHYNTTGASGNTEILTLSGPAPAAGEVELKINYSNGTLEYSTKASIKPLETCATPTPTPTPTPLRPQLPLRPRPQLPPQLPPRPQPRPRHQPCQSSPSGLGPERPRPARLTLR